MTSAGLVGIVVVDDYLARFWSQVLPGLVLHENVAVRTGAELAPAFRKDSPQLEALFTEAAKASGAKTAFTNEAFRRYLKQTKYVKNATSEADMKRFRELVEHFKTYGDKYQLDWLMMAAQGYQESRLDQNAKSHVGAVGVMQVMPATGKELAVGDIHKTEANIHAGVKYVRFMIDQCYKDEPKKLGLNENVWFGNVERVAAKRIGRETVTYVANIYKYAVAYQLAMKQIAERKATKDAASD